MKARIYTKTGDKGQTSLVDGSRVSKGDRRLETYGTLDELNSVIGLIRSRLSASEPTQARLQMIQNNLFNIGSHLACADEKIKANLPGLSADALSDLETDMDRWEAELPPLKEFILPGGSEPAAMGHLARTVCRRAEREIVRVMTEGAIVSGEHVIFINRLSDWLFLAARKLNSDRNIKDTTWSKG